MTVIDAFMGLLPIMWTGGSGSDVMRRIAAPMVGGACNEFYLRTPRLSGGLLYVEE